MVIPEDIKDIVIRFSREAKKTFDIDKIVLFGSYANGTATELSDIDIAVQMSSKNHGNILEIGIKLWNIAAKIDIRIEPKIFFSEDYDPNEPASIYNHILRTGIDIKIN
ncbi:MAG: nucleotidyltransferase domain-containing protein [bacterium]